MIIYNTTLVGGCFGLLSILLMTSFTEYLSSYFSFRIPNHKANNIYDVESLSSSIWCSNRFDGSKLCKFKNLYYLPEFTEHFLFLMNEFSVVSGVEDLKQLSLSTVQNHSGVHLKLIIIKSGEYLLGQNISYLETDSFILKTFKSDNIMHVIHDDLLPLFVTYKELCNGDISLCTSLYQLIIIDNNDHRPYFEWYMHFSVHKPILIAKELHPLCIKRGIFGLSNSSIWFQYGFKTVQGPLINNYINSNLLVEFSDFIKHQFRLSTDEISSLHLRTIVLLSRKINRKILNENIMEEKIINIAETALKTNITLLNLDLSTNSSKVIIDSLQRSQILVGVHGSALILAIFMQPGSHFIEIFPFGIQPEVVSPLRGLCKLKNVVYNYNSWVNMNESNTRTHPEYPPLLGGIYHLEDSKQSMITNIKKVPAVECCHDPVYLFRMFQDTIVGDSFFSLFHKVVSNYEGLKLPKEKVKEQNLEMILTKWYFPPPVFNLTCKCDKSTLNVTWDYPFISPATVFSVATSYGLSAITKLTDFAVNLEKYSSLRNCQEQSLAVWVQTVDGDKRSLDSFTKCISSE